MFHIKLYSIVILSLGGFFTIIFNTVLEKTDTLEFCISCHSMRNTVYQEYKKSAHYQNRTGIRAGCSDCHTPKAFIPKLVRKLEASADVYHTIIGTIDTKEKFESRRLRLAQKVWARMKESDSRECRSCHNKEAMDLIKQKRRAKVQHVTAEQENETCIDCHKGIVHKPVHKEMIDSADDEENFVL